MRLLKTQYGTQKHRRRCGDSGAGVFLYCLYGRQHLIGGEGEFQEAGAGGVVDGVGEDGRRPVDADLGNALCAEGAGILVRRDQDGLDGRTVAHGVDVVVGEGRVGHAPVVEEVLLGEGVADPVEGSALGLAFAERGIDSCSAIYRRDVLDHAYEPGKETGDSAEWH